MWQGLTDPQWQGQEGPLDPLTFYPPRWEGARGPGTQMPFGHGKHYCLGQPLAMMEARVALAVLARRFEVKVVQETTKWVTLPVLHPANQLPVVLLPK